MEDRVMAAGKESLFAQFALLNYLKGSRGPRSVREILSYLHNNTNWGRAQLVSGPDDKGLRNLQNWLRDIRESAEFGQQIDWDEDPGNRKQYRYKSRLPVVGNPEMPIEEACMVLMADKLLSVLVPADFYDASLQDLFRTAKQVLNKYDQRPKNAKRMVSSYLKRIAIAQRGQDLVQRFVPYGVLGTISKAMLDGKCIDLRYKGRKCQLHPYGIVVRGPKIYLLAVDERAYLKVPSCDIKPAHYLCVRMSDAEISERRNKVPEEFDANQYIAKGGLEAGSHDESGLPARGFTLKLRIFDGESDNLLQDIDEFPLSMSQSIEKEKGTRNHILTAPGMRASHQLTEWILGRLDRVEVLAPVKLRTHVAEQVSAVHALYRKHG
jgi:predicted DNA-binding transcriptional regulator YafY